MTDHLEDQEERGLEAGLRIIADYAEHRRDDHETATNEVVAAIRTAAANDNKFNYHLLERIAVLAAMGFESVNDPSTSTE